MGRRVGALVLLSLIACGGDDSTQVAPTPSASTAPSATQTTASACTPAALERRAAQVLVVGFPEAAASSDPSVREVLDVAVGGVLITTPNVESSEQLGQLVSDVKARAGRPILVAAGEEGGRVSAVRDVIGRTPSPRTLAGRTPDAVRQHASETGTKLAALGVTVNLAPVLDLDAGPAGGTIGDRSFSADPQAAARYGVAFARGMAAARVHPVAKHFPGHGRSHGDTHRGLPLVDASLEELRASDFVPFAEAIRAGIPGVMIDHVAYTALGRDLPASLSPAVYRLLREMGFRGVAMTDSLGMGAVNLQWPFPEAAVRAIEAGADAVLATDGGQARPMRDAIVAAVKSGRIPEERLNEAAGRVAALAGADARALTCRSIELPRMEG